MADCAAQDRPVSYRLRGEVNGEVMTFHLATGEYRVGALRENEICLQVDTVSRRHAVIRREGSTVTVEDRGSKNGVWVNGVRVERSVLRPGDWVGFGPVVLYLEEIDPADSELAIGLEDGRLERHRRSARDDTETRARRKEDEPPRWVTLLSALMRLLAGDHDPDLGPAMDLLRRELGAGAAALVECTRPEPSVLACAGKMKAPPPDVLARAPELAERAKTRATVAAQLDEDPEPVAWAMGAVDGLDPWLLVVWGEFPDRRASRPLLEAVLRLLLHARPEPVYLGAGPAKQRQLPDLTVPPDHVVGRSAAMRRVYEQLRQLVCGDIPVLILGETGVGKEHVARILHQSSDRAEGPFVAVNCAAIPPELLEAELFGIERGVATGVTARPGKFQLAAGGTLFLDEIGDMSLDLQAKVLRALQQMEVHPLGAPLPQRIDVRVVTATNTRLSERILDGRFRRDLYYRVAGFTVQIPPLRERKEDIPALVEHFLRKYAAEVEKPIRGITVKALKALTEAPWLGNVRELEHEVRRLVYLCPPGQAIDSTLLSPEVAYPAAGLDLGSLGLEGDLSLEPRVAELERKLISIALARTRGNRSKAAKLLGISRNGLALKMDRLGIER